MSRINENYLIDLKFNGDLIPTNSRDITQIKNKENVLQAIYNRIVTSKGSIVHRPNYGFGIKGWLHKLNTLAAQRDMAVQLKEQIEKDDRVSELNGITVTQQTESVIIISLDITLVGGVAATLEVEGNVNENIISRRV